MGGKGQPLRKAIQGEPAGLERLVGLQRDRLLGVLELDQIGADARVDDDAVRIRRTVGLDPGSDVGRGAPAQAKLLGELALGGVHRVLVGLAEAAGHVPGAELGLVGAAQQQHPAV